MVAEDPLVDESVDDWDVRLDAAVAQDTLAALGAHHRSALTLRYLDGLPVAEVADVLGRTSAPPRCCSCGPRPRSAAHYEEVAR